MTRRPGGIALAAGVKARQALADPAESPAVVGPCPGPEPVRKAARETMERVNVKRDTP
jgi:hypothetical protein